MGTIDSGSLDLRGRFRALRLPLVALAMGALLLGMWEGLLRLGWGVEPLRPLWPMLHGPLMVCGFLGTLIGLERAVGTGRRWAYAAPVLAAVGAVVALAGLTAWLGPLLIVLSSAVLVAVMGLLWRLHPGQDATVMWLGSGLWLIGNLLWLAGWPVPLVVPWWIGFLVLTIAGERLELSRMLRLSRRVQLLFGSLVGVVTGGILLTAFVYGPGVRVMGVGLMGMALWLMRYDIARRRLKAGGQARFIAVCLLLGCVWLAVGGLLAVIYGGIMAGPDYDAMLHAVFLGFVFGMIFAHAPIVFPAVLHRPMRYTPVFYSHLLLLQASLLLRVSGDLLLWWPGRLWGGLLNVIVLLLFIVNTAVALRPVRPPAVESTPRTVPR